MTRQAIFGTSMKNLMSLFNQQDLYDEFYLISHQQDTTKSLILLHHQVYELISLIETHLQRSLKSYYPYNETSTIIYKFGSF